MSAPTNLIPTARMSGTPAAERTPGPRCRRCSAPTLTADAWPEFGPVCVACPLPIRLPGARTQPRTRTRAAILSLLAAAGTPLTRRVITEKLTAEPTGPGLSTIAKELAVMRTGGLLVNRRDQMGYRLAGEAERRT